MNGKPIPEVINTAPGPFYAPSIVAFTNQNCIEDIVDGFGENLVELEENLKSAVDNDYIDPDNDDASVVFVYQLIKVLRIKKSIVLSDQKFINKPEVKSGN